MGLLRGKGLIVSIGDWIREANERRWQRWRQEAIEEGYNLGYTDALQGKPPRPPGVSGKDGRGAPEADDNGRRGGQ